MNKSVLSIAAGIIGGIAVGWITRTAQTKRYELPEQPSLLDRIKRFERQLYRDGMQRANKINGIKREVENRL
jgi:hypothetical protein